MVYALTSSPGPIICSAGITTPALVAFQPIMRFFSIQSYAVVRDIFRRSAASEIPPAKRGGRRRGIDVREVLNAIFYVLSTGCQWKALPKDLPPKSTAHAYFMLWDWDGTLERFQPWHALCAI